MNILPKDCICTIQPKHYDNEGRCEEISKNFRQEIFKSQNFSKNWGFSRDPPPNVDTITYYNSVFIPIYIFYV